LNDLNKRIRQVQRQMWIEKLKENYWVLLIILSLTASYTAYSIPGDSRNIEAVVIKATYPDTDKEHIGVVDVQLADDHQVTIDVPNKGKHLTKGDRIELLESTTFFLEVQSYRYVKAID